MDNFYRSVIRYDAKTNLFYIDDGTLKTKPLFIQYEIDYKTNQVDLFLFLEKLKCIFTITYDLNSREIKGFREIIKYIFI